MDTGSKKTPQTKQEADDKDNEEEQSDPLMKAMDECLKGPSGVSCQFLLIGVSKLSSQNVLVSL